MKKLLIVAGVAILALTGLSSTAGATQERYDGEKGISVDCDSKLLKWVDAEDVADFADDLYEDLHDAVVENSEDGVIDLPGPLGSVTAVVTGDGDNGTITITDEGQTLLTASLVDGEFSFEASLVIEDFLSANVSFYRDRLGELCGDEPFSVCLNNAVFLVEADSLADYLAENPTAVVINAAVGCPGAPGSDGEDGEDGSDGADGAQGPAGPAGETVVIEKIVTVQAEAPKAAAPVALPRTA